MPASAVIALALSVVERSVQSRPSVPRMPGVAWMGIIVPFCGGAPALREAVSAWSPGWSPISLERDAAMSAFLS